MSDICKSQTILGVQFMSRNFGGISFFKRSCLLLNIWGIRIHYSGDAYSIHDVVKLVSDFNFYMKTL